MIINNTVETYKKNISDIDKILEIYKFNNDIKDNNILKQLKSKKNNYIIKLYNIQSNIHTLETVVKITKLKIDYKNHSAMITFLMEDGTKKQQLYPIDKLRMVNTELGDMEYV